MRRFFLAVFATFFLMSSGNANAQTEVRRDLGGVLTLQFDLDRSVPFRVTHLRGPDRIRIDLRAASLPSTELAPVGRITALRRSRAGRWTGVTALLDQPMVLDAAAYTAPGRLSVRLRPTDPASFALAALDLSDAPKDKPLIVLDPGHGGIDPGALRFGVAEKDVTLTFGLELAELLRSSGRYKVLLTRKTDKFVPLSGRVEIAREAGADLFLSLHANTLLKGDLSGSTVYVLSRIASDAQSAAMAEFENRADIVAGHTAAPGDGDIADILLELNRSATAKRSGIAARLLVQNLADSVGVVENKPLKSANFKVLRAPDMPSILLEFGFLSNQTDLARMQSPEWRAEAGNAVLNMLDAWQKQDGDRMMITDVGQ
ncbi:N-acetylmuramoyl-L-alanine amidase family protein [Halovulum sp. GXIMD14793]